MKVFSQKEFELFGTSWKLKDVDVIKSDDDNLLCKGTTDSAVYEISIARRSEDDKVFSSKDKELTKIHELVHAMLFTGQYLNVGADEPLVEWLARCIYSLKQQKIL